MDNQPHDIYSSVKKVGIEPTFFGKVMSFFALAILASLIGTYVTSQYFMHFFIQTPALMYLFFTLELIIVFTSRMWSKKRPLNRILFALFAFITGVTIAPLITVLLSSAAGTAIFTKALFATVFMFGATAIFGWTTKINLTGLRGFLFMGLIGLIVVGILGIFFPWGNQMEIIYSGFGVLLFSGFIMYDFQKIRNYPEDRYIDAALALYLDIFNLFLMLLRLLTAMSRD